MQLYLVRHPRPSNVDGLCYGRLDVSVAATAVSSTAESVKARIPCSTLLAATVYSSPASRCLELARQLAAPREAIVSDELVEMDFGDWQGVAWDTVPRDQLDAWTQDVWGYQPGGGESAEMVLVRWRHWLASIRQSTARTVLAITHAGVIRVALDAPLTTHVPFGSVHCLDVI